MTSLRIAAVAVFLTFVAFAHTAAAQTFCGATDAGFAPEIAFAASFTLDLSTSTFQFFGGCSINGTVTQGKDQSLYLLTTQSTFCSFQFQIHSAQVLPRSDFSAPALLLNGVSSGTPWYVVAVEDQCTNVIPAGVYCATLSYQYTVSGFTQAPHMITLSFMLPGQTCQMNGNYYLSSSTNQTAVAWTDSTCNASKVMVKNIAVAENPWALLVSYSLTGNYFTTANLTTWACEQMNTPI